MRSIERDKQEIKHQLQVVKNILDAYKLERDHLDYLVSNYPLVSEKYINRYISGAIGIEEVLSKVTIPARWSHED